MNATNRGINRCVLFIAGLVLVVAGVAAGMAALWPAAQNVWLDWTVSAQNWVVEIDEASRITENTTLSWFTLGLLAVLLLVVVLAMSIIARLGGGRSGSVLREEATDGVRGAVTIGHGFASDAITHSLNSREEIHSSRVGVRRVQGTDVLQVNVTPRQSTSPVDVAETVRTLVDNLATLTGRETPTFVSINSGIRARLAADHSRVN